MHRAVMWKNFIKFNYFIFNSRNVKKSHKKSAQKKVSMKSCRNLKQVSETRYKKFIFYSIFMAFPAYKTGISREWREWWRRKNFFTRKQSRHETILNINADNLIALVHYCKSNTWNVLKGNRQLAHILLSFLGNF